MKIDIIKKYAYIIICIAVLCVPVILSGCSPETVLKREPTPVPIITVNPEELITTVDVSAVAAYVPVQEKSDSDGVETVLYRSEPVGQGDIVKVSVRQYSDSVAKDDIKAEYERAKSLRPKAEVVDGIGDDAYIAYPSVHIYRDGYHVTITAGSGSGDEQKTLLEQLAKTADDRLKDMLGSQ